MRHQWFRDEQPMTCPACGQLDCAGRILVEFCPAWQRSAALAERGKYLPTSEPVIYEVTFVDHSLSDE